MRDVNISITNIRQTGQNVNIPQRAADVSMTWVDDSGQTRSDSRSVNIPNIWTHASIPPEWLRDQLVDLTIRAIRIIAGIDQP